MSGKRKHEVSYDLEQNAVIIDGDVFRFDDLPALAKQYVSFRGLSAMLMSADNMQQRYAGLMAGKLRDKPGTKRGRLGKWHQAAAAVYAEAQVRGAGVKPPPGKNVRATSQYAEALKQAESVVLKWTQAQLARAKCHPDVIAEYTKQTGKVKNLSALFGGSDVATTGKAHNTAAEQKAAA